MSKASWWDDVDDLFGMFDMDTEKAAEKKKKKKKKKDSGVKVTGPGDFKKIKKSLKGLSRSELLKRIDSLGIMLDGVDVKNKKSMRNAIAQRMCDMPQGGSGSSYVDKQTGADKVSVGLSAAEHEAKINAMRKRPPYYIDEDSQDFVIPNCLQADDMTCFNGMMSLGAYRRDKRPSDGFGELMYRISKKLRELPDTAPQDVIDVTDFKVHDVADEEPEKIGPQPPRYKPAEVPALPEGKRPVAGKDIISGPNQKKRR